MKALVRVMPKRSVLDPQGVAVRGALEHLGFAGLGAVRIGRLVEIDLGETGPEGLEERLHAACRDLLSNPVIEEYTLEIVR